MKTVQNIITEALNSAKGDEAVQEAVNKILGEDIENAVGSEVAVIGDPTFPYDGMRGKVKGPSSKGSGFVDVSFSDGVTVPLQSSLLLKV